jgi:hypothetical protein
VKIDAHSRVGAITARMGGIELSGVPEWIMWMPAGVHKIHASSNGKPKVLRVLVERETALTLQRALTEHMTATRQRPFFDFDHANGAASAWPVGFEWRDGPQAGVYARIEWSDDGRTKVSGRAYRAFSPSFFVDASSPARVTGAPLNMGGLVNDPAFKAMAPIWSKQSDMNITAKLLAALAALQTLRSARAPLQAKATDDAGKAALNSHDQQIDAKLSEIETLRASVAAEAADDSNTERAEAALAAKEAELATLQAKADRLERERSTRIEADAEAAIKVAVERGAIAAQDTATQAQWKKLLVADPAHSALLAKLPGNPALGAPIVASDASQRTTVQTVQGDSRKALEAFAAIADPTERAQFWAKDLRPRVEKGNDFRSEVQAIQSDLLDSKYEIKAANSLGSLSGVLVVQRSLDFLKLTFPVLTRISTDFSAESAKFNQTIQTRIRGALTIQNFNPAVGYQDQDATTTDVPVVINQHQYVQVSFGVNEVASTMRGLFDEQEQPMHYALGKAICDQMYALITAGNYTNATTQALVGFGRNTVVDIGAALAQRGVAGPNMSILLNAAYYGGLSKDSVLVNLATYQPQESSLIKGRTLPPIADLMPIEAINLPGTGNLTGFALRPDAMAIATRVPNDYVQALPGVPSTARLQVVTNPDTGISVLLTLYVDHNFGAARGRIAIMYGVAKGQPGSGQRIISA